LGLPICSALAALAALGCTGDDANSTPVPSGTDGGGTDGGTPIADATVGSDGSQDANESVITDHTPIPYDGAAPPGPPRTPVTSEVVSARTDVQSLMFAAGEMQISGEPFAEFFAGRNLNDYDRTFLPPNQYLIPVTNDAGGPGVVDDNGFGRVLPVTDLFGFATAVESYEYSKMHMNMVCNQTTAGLSLANGPIVGGRSEMTSLQRLQARASELLTAAGSDIAGYAQLPPPTDDAGVTNPLNYLGFQGLWPNFAPFKSFDPAMQPTNQVVASCTFAGGYGGIPTINAQIPEYECAYNGLHLPNRETQVDKTLVPAVIGFSTWKEALWSIDFAGRLHDSGSNPVTSVNAADRPLVGTKKNTVLGGDNGAVAGTYLGSTPLEDMWGLTMLDEMDNAAEYLVGSLTTADGAALGGFVNKATALAYDYTTAFRWFPAAIAVTEDTSSVPYPAVSKLAITDPTSRSVDLSALLLGYSMFFAETDARNVGVGQRIGLQLTFDGDPFAADNGLPDGENSAHDRALSVLRVAVIDLDRAHFVPLSGGAGAIVDTATVANGVPTPGSTVTTTNLAHSVIALRQALLSLNGAITQYGAADPDPAADVNGILNTPAIHPTAPGAATTMSPRLRQLIAATGTFARDVLTKADGTVANGATIASGVATPTTDATSVESQAAALRALTETYLVTNDPSYLDRARAVATKLETSFYDAPARMFIGVLGGAVDVSMTPERWGWLESALRETHKVLHVEGDPSLGRAVLEDRIARSIKLFLNGWDDLNGDQSVDTKTECLAGRLQQAEQALTGELGLDAFGQPATDRDLDCVPEVPAKQSASVLASEVHFHSP
jgi:hypothetical protein